MSNAIFHENRGTYVPEVKLEVLSKQYKNHRKYFYLFCFLHLILWTLGPMLVRGSVTHDTVEGIAWGLQWQLGYDKHPPLTAWLCALFTELGGSVGWPVYLLAQCAVVTAFFAVWRLANKILTSLPALLSVLMLEGIIFYNRTSPNITPDTMQTPIWALTIWLFYLALTEKKYANWLWLGVLAGLAIITKYQAIILFAAMGLVLVLTTEGRRSFLKLGPYLGLILLLAVIIPHLIWSYQQGFPEIAYARSSTVGEMHQILGLPNYLQWFLNPLKSIVNELGATLGLFVMSLPFIWQKFTKDRNATTAPSISASQIRIMETRERERFNRMFLLIMGLGPFFLSLFYSIFSGGALVHRWNTPYFSLLGILLLYFLKPQITFESLKRFLILFVTIALLTLVGRYGYLLFTPYLTGYAQADAYFPGKNIATTITNEWERRYHTPLKYVAGEHYLTAYVNAYSQEKPIPYMSWSTNESPWVNEKDLRLKGAVFVWRVTDARNISIDPAVKARFPNISSIQTYTFKKMTGAHVAPITLAVVYLPPERNV